MADEETLSGVFAVAQEVEHVVKEKSNYSIEECIDCGKRRKSYRDSCCMDCWLFLEVKREKIRARCAKGKK